jgi:hypothetical protein
MTRLAGLDALRGLMLVLMTLTHIPTSIGSAFGQPFGYVSAAEGFVLLSGFMAGLVFSRRLERHGAPAMRSALQRRAVQIYLCHIALLMFVFSVVAAMGVLLDQPAVINMLGFFFEQPLQALLSSTLLVYRPPLLDILPMYTAFLIVTPLLLGHGARGGWPLILGLSVTLWLGAQYSLGARAYEALTGLLGLPVPLDATGSFVLPAWQLLWVVGLWLGARHGDADNPLQRLPEGIVKLALAIAVLAFMWRHMVGQTPFPDWPSLNLLFDKWQLGPLRVLNVLALTIVLARLGPALMGYAPSMRPLETLGAASLPVFCAHLVIALMVITLFGDTRQPALWLELLMLATSLWLLHRIAQRSIARRQAPTDSGQLA